MSKINYDRTWKLRVKDLTKEEWDMLIRMLQDQGVEFFSMSYGTHWEWLAPSRNRDKLSLWNNCTSVDSLRPVSFLQMMYRLTDDNSEVKRELAEVKNRIIIRSTDLAAATKARDFISDDLKELNITQANLLEQLK